MSESLLRTPLHELHVQSGGKMVPFAGYDMPVQYEGILAEARAVRESVGMFDVSHMARVDVVGTDSLPCLERVTANQVSDLDVGQGQYSLLPNEAGGTVDDIIVYRIGDMAYRLVLNASNHEKDVQWLRSHAPDTVEIRDFTEESAMIAVQGPRAASILEGLSNCPQDVHAAPLFGLVSGTFAGIPAFAARSGYTGEDGFELICAASDAALLWKELADAGAVPCGLGSRDTLRVEAGLPLYGHELADDLSPIAAGLGWVIAKEKAYLGSDFIERARAEGTPRRLLGVRLATKRLIPVGALICIGGREVGSISSGVVSPTLDCGIGFAFVDREVKMNTECTVELRSKPEPAVLVNKRFLKKT
jgi:aminomethyltransferase